MIKKEKPYMTIEEFRHVFDKPDEVLGKDKEKEENPKQDSQKSDYESDLAHYKIIKLPLCERLGETPCYLIAKKLKSPTPLYLYADLGWHFIDGSRKYGSFEMALANVESMLNQDSFDSAKIKILDGLNKQVITVPNTEKGNDWLAKMFWQYVKEKEEEENRIKEEQEKILEGKISN